MFRSTPSATSLRLTLDDNVLYLRPSTLEESMDLPSDYSQDSIVHGNLILNLSAPKRVKSIKVRLVYEYSVASLENGEKVVNEVSLTDEETDRVFVKGEHTFAFSIIIPSSTAPYEHCDHGALDHKIVAVVQWEGFLSSYVTTSLPIVIIANPAPAGETSPFDMSVQDYKPELGAYSISTTAQHLTVGGLVTFDYRLASVPETINIISLSATLVSTVNVRSVKDPKVALTRSFRRTTLYDINAHASLHKFTHLHVATFDKEGEAIPFTPPHKSHAVGSPLQVVPSGGSFHFSHLIRFPSDHVIRPTTLPGTKTPFRIQHELLVKLRFARADHTPGLGDKSELPFDLLVNRPLVLSSCGCMVPSLILPRYSEVVVKDDDIPDVEFESRPPIYVKVDVP